MRHHLPLALLLASSVIACVDSTTTDDTATDTNVVTSQLEQDNGGLDMEDEAPLFGEGLAYDALALESDATVVDPMASDPEVATMERAVDGVRHRILIAWGRMPVDPNATDGRDWSGSLTISRGAIVVGRTVGFEQVTDRLLPRDSRDRVDFRSETRPFADGLVLRVLDPDPTAGALHLRYTSADASITHDIDLSQLVDGRISIDAGDGNRVVVVALRERDACDHGFMRGRWLALREHLGVYRGVIVDADGAPIGHIRGIWGQRQNGDKVMFGKLIDLEGHFRGILAGTYDAGDFRARWITRAGEHGVAGGHYFDSPQLRGGGFMGRWGETSCAQ